MINTSATLYGFNHKFKFMNQLLMSNQLPSSIIFSGEKGIGKRTFLLHFFAYLNLSKIEKDNYNDSFYIENSEIFKSIDSNMLTNIKIIKKIDKSQNITIDQIRDIILFCSFEAFEDKPRFILIQNVEDMNINASNAFLKILENPPKKTYFFLIKNSNSKINNTVISRCHKFNLKINISQSDLIFKELLNKIDLKDFLNYSIFNSFDTHGSKINRIYYLLKNKIEDLNLLEIVKFCLMDFKKNKNHEAFFYAGEFAKNFFRIRFEKNFKRTNYFYKLFINNIEKNLKFNLDVNSTIQILNKIK
jgi:DNA polymerase-3 subunit delta'